MTIRTPDASAPRRRRTRTGADVERGAEPDDLDQDEAVPDLPPRRRTGRPRGVDEARAALAVVLDVDRPDVDPDERARADALIDDVLALCARDVRRRERGECA